VWFDLPYIFFLRNVSFLEELSEILSKMYIGLRTSACYSWHILLRHEFSRQIFEKYSDIQFQEHLSNGNRVVSCGRTDVTKLIVVVSNFGNAPKKNC
jgi:hypothetical protein